MTQPKDRRAEKARSVIQPAGPTAPQLESAAATFALLSNPARLHVLWLAAHDHHDVTALAERAGVGVATMSQHLTKLRLAGLVRTRREGNHVFYLADNGHLRALVEEALFHADHVVQRLPDHGRQPRCAPPAGGHR